MIRLMSHKNMEPFRVSVSRKALVVFVCVCAGFLVFTSLAYKNIVRAIVCADGFTTCGYCYECDCIEFHNQFDCECKDKESCTGCTGGECYKVSGCGSCNGGGCHCKSGTCTRNTNCNPSCPAACDTGNCTTCIVTCSCTNSRTCEINAGGDPPPDDPPPDDPPSPDCGNGVVDINEDCDPPAESSGFCDGRKCKINCKCARPNPGGECSCDCSTLARPDTPSPLSPANGETGVPPAGATLTWSLNGFDQWGQDQNWCAEVSPFTCVPGNSDPDDNRKYELYLSQTNPASLPSSVTPCDANDYNFLCSVTTNSYTISMGGSYAPLDAGSVYYWSVRAVNPGTGGFPGGGGVSCDTRSDWSPVRSFRVNVPPEITMISVTGDLPCEKTAGVPSRWTGSIADGESGINNPIDINVAVYDEDGDIQNAINQMQLVLTSSDSKYLLPYNCSDELKDYYSVNYYPGAGRTSGWESAVAIEIDQSECEPNCTYDTQLECDAINGCTWNQDSDNTFLPPGCAGCRRDWAEVSFDPNAPLYQFDRSCQYLSGEPTGCNGCYFKSEHPYYKINSISESNRDDFSALYTFNVTFYDTFPQGLMQMYAFARNRFTGVSLFSGGDNPGCTDYDTCRTTDTGWTWGFDFDSPILTLSGEHRGEGDPGGPDDPDEFWFIQDAIAEEPRGDGTPLELLDSGLKQVYDRQWWVVHDDGSTNPPEGGTNQIGPNWSVPAPYAFDNEWSSDDVKDGFSGGDTIYASFNAKDMACNTSSIEYNSGQIGLEWLMTLGGDVYGHLGLSDPIPTSGDPMVKYDLSRPPSTPLALSEFWLGGGAVGSCSATNFLDGRGSSQGPLWWCSSEYIDQNRESGGDVSWYDTLMRYAQNSEWMDEDPSRHIEVIENGGVLQSRLEEDDDFVMEYMGAPDESLVLLSDTECVGKKIVFIRNTQTDIEPGFGTTGDGVCLFVSDGEQEMFVVGGASNGGDAEIVRGGFVTNGAFTVLPDEPEGAILYDPLMIKGFVFAGGGASFERDLVFSDNWETPAELIEYEGGDYMQMLREMLGRRTINSFECGVVTGSGLCTGWYGE